jgi:transposase-like protein
MCSMTCCPCKIDLEKIKPLVAEPKFICTACGRVANEENNLCEPQPLN